MYFIGRVLLPHFGVGRNQLDKVGRFEEAWGSDGAAIGGKQRKDVHGTISGTDVSDAVDSGTVVSGTDVSGTDVSGTIVSKLSATRRQLVEKKFFLHSVPQNYPRN